MQARIVFLVMSAVSKPATLEQLARALAPHTALVHHDFSQTPHFPLGATNVRFVPDPKRTGWAYFGFVDGIFHSLRYALSHLDFDYLQLLSPTCLPIKPMALFEERAASGADANFDCIDLLRDRDALMSVGYRAFTPESSLRHLVARRASNIYYGDSTGRRDEAGIWLRSGGGDTLPARLAAWYIEALSRPSIGRHLFDDTFRPYYGTPWFGARRDTVAELVRLFDRPGVRRYFSRLRIAEEFLFPTLLMQLVVHKGPMNHVLKKYEGAHTGQFDDNDLGLLRDCDGYFARKFPDDPAAPIRMRVLEELVGVPQAFVRVAAQESRDRQRMPESRRSTSPSSTGAVSGRSSPSPL